MKRTIIFVSLIIIVILGYQFFTKGVKNNMLNIASYNTIEKKSEALTKKLANYNKKNQEEYETAITSLASTQKSYDESKKKYEEIFDELAEVLNKNEDDQNPEETIEEIIYSDKEKYKVDFLLVTLGDYGEKEGVDVVYQLTTSSTTDPNSSTLNYFLSDLNFTVTGQYINVANFIADLESDNKLEWVIRNLSMTTGSANGYSGVTATFTIKDVPIDSESYLTSTGTSTTTTTTTTTTNTTQNGDLTNNTNQNGQTTTTDSTLNGTQTTNNSGTTNPVGTNN